MSAGRMSSVSSMEGWKWSGCIRSYSLYKASSETEKSYSEMSVLPAERFNYGKSLEYLEFVFKGHGLLVFPRTICLNFLSLSLSLSEKVVKALQEEIHTY